MFIRCSIESFTVEMEVKVLLMRIAAVAVSLHSDVRRKEVRDWERTWMNVRGGQRREMSMRAQEHMYVRTRQVKHVVRY